MTVIAELAVNGVVNTQGVSRGVGEFRKEVGSLRSDVTAGMASIGAATAGATAVAAAGYYAVGRAIDLVADRAAKFDMLASKADTLGLGVERLQEFQFAAGQLSAAESGQLETSLGKMEASIYDAAQGLGKGRVALDNMRLSAERLVDLPVDEQLYKIADAMHDMDAAARLSAAKRLGIDPELVPFLAKGSGGIREMASEARRLGIVIDDSMVRSLADTNDALDAAKASISSVGDQLAGSLAPHIRDGADALGGFIGELREFWKMRTMLVQMIEQPAQLAINMVQDNANERKRMEEIAANRKAALEARRQERLEEQQEREAEQRQKEKDRTTAQLEANERRIDQFNMSDRERNIDDVRREQTDPAVRDRMIDQANRLDALTKAKERDLEVEHQRLAAQDRANQLLQDSLSPLDALQKKLLEIDDLRQRGMLTNEQAIAAAERLRPDQAGDETDARRGPNAAIKFGSVEAFRAIRESSKENEVPKKQLKEAEKTNDKLDKVIDSFKERATTPFPWN